MDGVLSLLSFQSAHSVQGLMGWNVLGSGQSVIDWLYSMCFLTAMTEAVPFWLVAFKGSPSITNGSISEDAK